MIIHFTINICFIKFVILMTLSDFCSNCVILAYNNICIKRAIIYTIERRRVCGW